MKLKKRRYSRSGTGCYYWFLVDGKKVGNAMVTLNSLFNFNILPKYRNRGYATKFMSAIVDDCSTLKRLHAKSCDTKNGLSTDELVDFYRKFGFTVFNTTHPYGILMTKTVDR